MKLKIKDFCVDEGKSINLKKWSTNIEPLYHSKEDFHEYQIDYIKEMGELQNLLYAHNRYSLLLIFQAMDAAGKDSAIKQVMSGVNPQGCQVFSFKHPSPEEMDHDFLWRTTRCLPERGRIGIFNRSYYEEVLIVKVHPNILQAQSLPKEFVDEKTIWPQRYKSILNLEKHLHYNGTQVVKIFLHLSKDEQRKRFIDRIDNPNKNWKFSSNDIKERELWDQYMSAYEDCLSATSTNDSPWYIVPADDKKNSQLIIMKVIQETLKGLNMKYPNLDQKQLDELKEIRKSLDK